MYYSSIASTSRETPHRCMSCRQQSFVDTSPSEIHTPSNKPLEADFPGNGDNANTERCLCGKALTSAFRRPPCGGVCPPPPFPDTTLSAIHFQGECFIACFTVYTIPLCSTSYSQFLKLSFLSRIGFSIPTDRRFSSNAAISHSRAFR